MTRDLCEWNLFLKQAALHRPLGTPINDGSCPNEAELIVGANGKWRLCRSCYEGDTKKFGRFRVVKEVIRGPKDR